MTHVEPEIPSRRRSADLHLRAAAKSSLGTDEESYSIQASQAEALINISEALVRIANGIEDLVAKS